MRPLHRPASLASSDASLTEPRVDGVKELACQLVLLQQMAEVHDGRAVRDGLVQGEFGKQTHRGNLLECVFHGAVAEVIPLLHAVNAEHDVEWIGTTTVTRFGVDRFDETEHSGPWDQSVHAGQEYLFAGFAAFTIELAIRESALMTHAEPHL
jgi:hypothetical protein